MLNTTTLSPAVGGTWQSNNNSTAIVSSSGIVVGLTPGLVNFTFTSSTTGCSSELADDLLVSEDLTAVIDAFGSECLDDNTKLIANVTGGTMEFDYNWLGPGGITLISDTIQIYNSGNYYLTVTDEAGCSDISSTYVYPPYDPIIFTLSEEVCEGDEVTLSINSPTANTYQWGNNAQNSTSQSVTVTPNKPSEDYYVTVTNNIGCTSETYAHIEVIEKPIVFISGSNTICLGETTTLSPASGGTWTSTNGTVASVSSSGIVYGLSEGTATFIYVDSITGCESDPTSPIEILGLPMVNLSGPSQICEGESTALLPSTGGYWSSSDSSVALVTDDGMVTSINDGVVSFTYTDSITGCASSPPIDLVVNQIEDAYFTGPDTICEGDLTYLFPTSGGTWSSSDTNIASVSNTGVVTAHSEGITTFTFTNNYFCVSNLITPLTVLQNDIITISGLSEVCENESITLNSSHTGGSWTSNDSTVTIIDNNGIVTGVNYGSATISYNLDSSICMLEPDHIITVLETPTAILDGPNEICIGDITHVTSSSTEGYWTSSNDSIAVVSEEGTIIGLSAGIVTFTYTSYANCISDEKIELTVNPQFHVDITILGSECLDNNTQLKAEISNVSSNYHYTWSGPEGFTSDQQMIDVELSGLYNVVVVDDNGCSSNANAFVFDSFDPVIHSQETSVCSGDSIMLEVLGVNLATFQWSSNTGLSNTQSVIVQPAGPNEIYSVTVTNVQGCIAESEIEISVDATPVINLLGSDTICVGSTTNFSPESGGFWFNSDYNIASITGGGLVLGLTEGVVTFTFRDTSIGCYSEASTFISVLGKEEIDIYGVSEFCLSDTPKLLTATVPNGIWSIENTDIATIDSLGFVTPHTAGTTNLFYSLPTDLCYNPASRTVHVQEEPNVSINGPSSICIGEVTYLVPSSEGVWESNDTTIATVSESGQVHAISEGNVTFTFTSALGCTSNLSTPITVVPEPILNIEGPNNICINETTNLYSSSNGIWISSNSNIATVNNSGVVTGISPGDVTFTFIETENGCISNEQLQLTVNPKPPISFPINSELCVGDTSSINPNVNGFWISSNTSVAQISNSGIITASAPGTAFFTFTDGSTGCNSESSSPVIVNDSPLINLIGPETICIGEIASLFPTSGSVWASVNPDVATVTDQGIITGVSPGLAQFIFTSNSTGCKSDSSEVVLVGEPTPVEITGEDRICIGNSTTLSPSSGGIWTISNDNIASVDNNGVVTAINPGVVTFIFISNDFCNSNPTAEVIIDPLPIPTYLGSTNICIGESTSLLPNFGGEWTSSDTTVAEITNDGIVTSVGVGTTSFIFTDSLTGCSGQTDILINVFPNPNIIIAGDDELCLGETTNILPSSGGIWFSSNPNIATVNNSGLVTAEGMGETTFTFVEIATGCQSTESQPVIVLPKPQVSIDGPSSICEGEFTTLISNSEGIWESTNIDIASISNDGVVNGISPGIAKFILISEEGCSSDETAPVVVNGKPVIVNDMDMLCLEDSLQLSPYSGGFWQSSDSSVATISQDGWINAVYPGTVTFTYTDNTTNCSSNESNPITINNDPVINLVGEDTICMGGTTNLFPSTGGIWTSLNPSIATITNNGEVSGINPGTANFLFFELSTGCSSDTSADITVLGVTEVAFTGDSILCIGDFSSITPSSSGAWTSTNSAVATISNDGIIEAVGQGFANFFFIENETGCISEYSNSLIVNGPPTIILDGNHEICIGSTTSLLPNSGGIWTSLDTSIATINSNGIVTALSSGVAHFTLQDSTTGCISVEPIDIVVKDEIPVSIVGDSTICIGYTTQLSPIGGGIWVSSNSKIAEVTNAGVVTGKAPGKVTFEFVDVSSGCEIGNTTNEIVVTNCLNHDFNVTLINQEVHGNLSTNDNTLTNVTYISSPNLISKPTGSLATLNIDTDGSYTFFSSTKGKYVYEVLVCQNPISSGCSKSILEVNVVESVNSDFNPISNLEFASTYTGTDSTLAGEEIILKIFSNDACVFTGECDIDSTTFSVIEQPTNGTVYVDLNGKIIYLADPGFIGKDTMWYQICLHQDNNKCSNSTNVITVNHLTAVNSTVAADDFAFALKENAITGNVLFNDSDPEGNNLSVIETGSDSTPIQVIGGSYYIDTQGNYTFIPEDGFTGSTEIIYTLCDDNIDIACSNATVHILVLDYVSVNIRMYLEGAIMQNEGATSNTSGEPLMRDDLRKSPFTGKNYIPICDPYTYQEDPFVNIPSQYNRLGPGLLTENLCIQDSLKVFSVIGENAIVDWVHIELMSKDDMTQPIATRSGLLQRDGDVVDLDGTSPLRFQGINVDSFYVVVNHRSHLGTMSMKVSNTELIDFTSIDFDVFDFGTSLGNGIDYAGLAQNTNAINGFNVLWSGDFDSDGKIKFTNPNDDHNIVFVDVLFSSPDFLANYNNAFGYYTGDFNMNSKTKYTNPNDDINYLFAQVLLYPLNGAFLANYNGFIEQIPNEE